MPAQRVAKLEALLVRVQTRAAESRAMRGLPANPTPMRRSHFDEDEVTGKVPAVAESPRAQPPQIVPIAAKSASKIAAAPAVAAAHQAEPVAAAPPVAAQVAVAAPAPVMAHAAPEAEIVVPEVFSAPPAPVQAMLDPTPLGPPFREVREPEVAPAKTPSPEPVAVAKALTKEPEAKRAVAVVPAPDAPSSRGRQFLVATLLMLWILVVVAVVGLFFTGRLPMP